MNSLLMCSNFTANLVEDNCGDVQSNVITLPTTCYYVDITNATHTKLDIGTCGKKSCISKNTTNVDS